MHCDLDGSYNGDIVLALSAEIDEIKRDLTLVEVKNNQMKKDLTRTELQLEHVRSDFDLYKDGSLPKNISGWVKYILRHKTRRLLTICYRIAFNKNQNPYRLVKASC